MTRQPVVEGISKAEVWRRIGPLSVERGYVSRIISRWGLRGLLDGVMGDTWGLAARQRLSGPRRGNSGPMASGTIFVGCQR
jgi:hypothetical protein